MQEDPVANKQTIVQTEIVCCSNNLQHRDKMPHSHRTVNNYVDAMAVVDNNASKGMATRNAQGMVTVAATGRDVALAGVVVHDSIV